MKAFLLCLFLAMGATSAFTGQRTWISGARQHVAAQSPLTTLQMSSLAWDDNAAWLDVCKSSGVSSWYDSGLRLTDGPEPETRAVGVVTAETAQWKRESAGATTAAAAEEPKRPALTAKQVKNNKRAAAHNEKKAAEAAQAAEAAATPPAETEAERLFGLKTAGKDVIARREARLEQYKAYTAATEAKAAARIAALTTEGAKRIAGRATMLEKYTNIVNKKLAEAEKKDAARIAALTAEGAERIAARAATLEKYNKISAEQSAEGDAKAAARIATLTAEGAERIAARAATLEKYNKISTEQRIAALTAEGAERIAARAAMLEQYTEISTAQRAEADAKAAARIAELTIEGERVIADRKIKAAAYEAWSAKARAAVIAGKWTIASTTDVDGEFTRALELELLEDGTVTMRRSAGPGGTWEVVPSATGDDTPSLVEASVKITLQTNRRGGYTQETLIEGQIAEGAFSGKATRQLLGSPSSAPITMTKGAEDEVAVSAGASPVAERVAARKAARKAALAT